MLHEYGHYKTAKIFGVHVEEFWLGIPPRAKKLWKNKEGTLFSLNWIPLWGFVKIAWESELIVKYYTKKWKKLSPEKILKKIKHGEDIFDSQNNEISKAERKYLIAKIQSETPGNNFYEKNIFIKTLILLAGVIMNFLLAGVIFSILFMIWIRPIGINSVIPTQLDSKIIPTLESSINSWLILENPWIILSPVEWSLAQSAWIESWDILISVEWNTMNDILKLQTYIIENKNSRVEVDIIRNSITITLSLDIPESGKIGSYLSPNYTVNENFSYSYNPWDAVKYWFYEVYAQSRLTLSGLGILWKNIFSPDTPQDRETALDSVAWPIWIVWVITSALSSGFTILIVLAAIISVNLWVFNLLPIPALDGGRILLLWVKALLDSIFWKRDFTQNLENSLHVLFFMILIALSILIAYNDIVKILFGE